MTCTDCETLPALPDQTRCASCHAHAAALAVIRPAPWIVTEHAITRYIERVRPRISRELARQELEAAASTAHYVGSRADGAERWRGPRPRRLRFIVEPGSPPKLITVLAGCEAGRRDRRARR